MLCHPIVPLPPAMLTVDVQHLVVAHCVYAAESFFGCVWTISRTKICEPIIRRPHSLGWDSLLCVSCFRHRRDLFHSGRNEQRKSYPPAFQSAMLQSTRRTSRSMLTAHHNCIPVSSPEIRAVAPPRLLRSWWGEPGPDAQPRLLFPSATSVPHPTRLWSESHRR